MDVDCSQTGARSGLRLRPPKGPAAGGKSSSAPVEAHFVGDKVCATCHAPQIAEFKKTLMGRIGKTQKGKFDCENCHGPGSAHVKAGGGRGVGGIMSFGPKPIRARRKKRTGFVSPAIRRATATIGPAARTRRAACLHELPHDHEERVAQVTI